MKEDRENLNQSVHEHDINLDQVWKIIESSIWKAAEESLPKRKVGIRKERKIKLKEATFQKIAKDLGYLIGSIRKSRDNSMSSHAVRGWNCKIRSINARASTSIDEVNVADLKNWLDKAVLWWKAI